jgi:hypothetical protein
MNRFKAAAIAKKIKVFLNIFVLSMKMPPPIMPNIPTKKTILLQELAAAHSIRRATTVD